jgi:hypothetical protein
MSEEARVAGQIEGAQLLFRNQYDEAEAQFAKAAATDAGSAIGSGVYSQFCLLWGWCFALSPPPPPPFL